MNAVLETGLTNAAAATVLALLAAVVARVSRRPALAHAFWLLVLLKLVTPPLCHVRLALPELPRSIAVPESRLADFSLGGPVPEPQAVAAATEAPPQPCPGEPGLATSSMSGEPSSPSETPAEPPTLPPPSPKGPLLPPQGSDTAWITPTILAFWLGGGFLCLGVALRRVWAFQHLLRHAQPAPESLQEHARRLALRLDLPHCPRVWLVPGAVSPLVWAVAGRARLILPSHLLERLGPEQRETLLAHELAHVLRRDHWVRWLELAATCLYWWFPVAWWARGQVQRHEEECCDAWVVQTLPAAARAYARALIETVNFLAEARPLLPPVASGLGYVPSLRRRIHMILREPLRHRLAWPTRLAAVLFGCLVLPLAPQRLAAARADDDDPPSARPADGEDAPPSTESRDLERRLRALERKMDRLTRALEQRARSRDGEASQKDMKDADQSAEEKRRAADEQRRAREERRRALEERLRAREAERHAHRGDGKGSAEGKAGTDKGDWSQLKDLDRRIQEAIDRATSPERMKELDRHIQEAIRRSINPQRMEAMAREIERSVNQAFSPERVEAMSRQIEAAVRHAMAAQDRARSALERSRAAAEKHAQAKSSSEQSTRSSSQSRRGSTDRSDLERRMDRLEQRLDRLLERIETQRGPSR